MSDNTSIKDVDKELANRVADKEGSRDSRDATEALLDLHLDTQAVGSRVSLSPKSNINSTEDVDEAAPIDEAEEESVSSDHEDDSDKQETGSEDSANESDDDGGEESKDAEESSLPIGWMSAQLQLLEEEVSNLKKERRKIKGQNTRLRQALNQRKAQFTEKEKELKQLKKENETLSKRLSDINLDTSVTAEVSKLNKQDAKSKLNEALKSKRNLEKDISKLETDIRKKDDIISKYKIRANELDSELTHQKKMHKDEIAFIRKALRSKEKVVEDLEKENKTLAKNACSFPL